MEKLAVGFIPDGHRRWNGTRSVQLDPIQLYGQGANTAIELVIATLKSGDISRLVFYCLSNEDVKNRKTEELQAIINAVRHFLAAIEPLEVDIGFLGNYRDVRIRDFVGQPVNRNKGKPLGVDVLVNYSPTWDLEGRPIKSNRIPDLDLVIRTAGAPRLSGFLPLQTTYAQLYFTNTPWPEFTAAEFLKIVDDCRMSLEEIKERGGRGT